MLRLSVKESAGDLYLYELRYSKNPYIRTLNFEGQAAIGSYSMITNSNIKLWFLNSFLIYETVNVQDNLDFYCSVPNFNRAIQVHVFSIC